MTGTVVRTDSLVLWRLWIIALSGGLVLHYILFAAWIPWAIRHGPWDYPIFQMASQRLFDGTMYQWEGGYIYPYSPVFAWLFAPFAWAGIWFWRALHLAALTLFTSWPIRVALLLSWGFWQDTWEGNVTVFLALAGYWAVRGNRLGGWAFLALAVMIPKPYMLPGVIWLLWKERVYRLGFAAILIGHGLAALATGYAFEWLAVLPTKVSDMGGPFNFLPSRFIGLWWMAAALPLAGWLLWKGRVGWASLAISPYAGAPQLMMLVMERGWPVLRHSLGMRPAQRLDRGRGSQ